MHRYLIGSAPAQKSVGALTVGVLLLTAGCATPTRVALSDTRRAQIGSAKTIGGLSQQELGVSIVVSTGGAGFGLIGAIIDSSKNNSRVKTAEAAAAPVRDALVGYEPGVVLKAVLSRELAPLKWLKGNTVEVRQLADSPKAVAELVKQSGKDVVLLVQTDYRLTPSFGGLVITAKVSLLPPPVPSSGESEQAGEPATPKAIYFNTLTTAAPLPGWTGQEIALEVAAKLWAENGGQKARRALDGGMADLARMIVFDLEQAGNGDGHYKGPPDAKQMKATGKYGSETVTGFVVRQENGHSWVRLPSGELNSVGEL
jgi:hypothetical protein